MKKIINYFLKGLLLTVPITVTGAFVLWGFELVDGFIPGLPQGLGLIIVFIFITIIGYLGSTIIASPINKFFHNLLKKAPLLETIYSSVKDLMNTFVGEKKGFKQAVFVRLFDNSTIERIGFITNKDLELLNINEGRVLVYIPHSYNFSGNLFVVERKYITPINAPSSEIMKLIVSGGVADFNDNIK